MNALLVVMTLIAVVLCSQECKAGTILEELIKREQETLLSLFNFAGIKDLLASEGPFTMFLPTQHALDSNVPQETMDQLVEDRTSLRQVLLGHIVPTRSLKLDELDNDMVLRTAADRCVGIRVNRYEDIVTVAGVPIIESDVVTDNGVVHFTDYPLLRPAQGNYIETLTMAPLLVENYKFEAVKRAFELMTTIDPIQTEDMSGMTFLAPIDSGQFTVTMVEHMFDNAPGDLVRLMRTLVIPETWFSVGLGTRRKVYTVDSSSFFITFSLDDGYVIEDEEGKRVADLIAGDEPTIIGVLHVLDRPIVLFGELPVITTEAATTAESSSFHWLNTTWVEDRQQRRLKRFNNSDV